MRAGQHVDQFLLAPMIDGAEWMSVVVLTFVVNIVKFVCYQVEDILNWNLNPLKQKFDMTYSLIILPEIESYDHSTMLTIKRM